MSRTASTHGSSTVVAVAVYTLLRIALFAAVWAVLWFLTPLDGLWTTVVALLVSGAISVVVLDRQRGRVGVAAGRFFSRINERIDASTRAEDIDDDVDERALSSSGDGEQHGEPQAVDQEQGAGALEGSDEDRPTSAAEDQPQR